MFKAPLSRKGLGFVLAIFSAITWGTNGTFCTLLGNFGFSTVNIAILAPVFNMIFFFSLLLFTNPAGFIVGWRMLWILLVDGIMASCANISFVKSVGYFPLGIVSTLVFCNIFVIMFLSRIFFNHKITLRKTTAAMAAVFGVGLVVDVFSQGFSLNTYGLVWILCTILSWSFMVILEKFLLEQGVDGIAVLMYTAGFAVLILSFLAPPWALVGEIIGISQKTSGIALLVVLGYGLIPQIGSYFLYMNGLRFIEPSYVQVAFSLDPVTASILGFLVFGQTLKISQICGILLILAVVGYLQFKENREGRSDSPPDLPSD